MRGWATKRVDSLYFYIFSSGTICLINIFGLSSCLPLLLENRFKFRLSIDCSEAASQIVSAQNMQFVFITRTSIGTTGISFLRL
jgi:hypothetical protein